MAPLQIYRRTPEKYTLHDHPWAALAEQAAEDIDTTKRIKFDQICLNSFVQKINTSYLQQSPTESFQNDRWHARPCAPAVHTGPQELHRGRGRAGAGDPQGHAGPALRRERRRVMMMPFICSCRNNKYSPGKRGGTPFKRINGDPLDDNDALTSVYEDDDFYQGFLPLWCRALVLTATCPSSSPMTTPAKGPKSQSKIGLQERYI